MNAKDEFGNTSLHLVAEEGLLEMAELLLKNGKFYLRRCEEVYE